MGKPRIAVIGAGLMGHGIAWRFAAAGHAVAVQDPHAPAIEALPRRIEDIRAFLDEDRAIAARVTGTPVLAAAVADADIVIEAAPERLALKQEIFAQLERHAPRDAILCSNTSVIPISDIAAKVTDRNRILGTHFWNPPHLVALVEIVLMGPDNRSAAERVAALLGEVGWHPVFVNRDIAGFIGNRLQHALKREAIALVAAGICDAETVDDVVKLGFGARLAVLGPLEQSDMVGLDLTKAIHDVLLPDLDVTPHTHPYLDALIEKGETGMKAGKGFRTWTPEAAEAVRERLRAFLAGMKNRRGNASRR